MILPSLPARVFGDKRSSCCKISTGSETKAVRFFLEGQASEYPIRCDWMRLAEGERASASLFAPFSRPMALIPFAPHFPPLMSYL